MTKLEIEAYVQAYKDDVPNLKNFLGEYEYCNAGWAEVFNSKQVQFKHEGSEIVYTFQNNKLSYRMQSKSGISHFNRSIECDVIGDGIHLHREGFGEIAPQIFYYVPFSELELISIKL